MNKKQVAESLGVSLRAVNRYAAAGKLRVSYRKTQGAKLEAEYDAEDVEKLRAAPLALSLSKPHSSAVTHRSPTGSTEALDRLQPFFEEIAARLKADGSVRIAEKLTLSLREASKLSGLSRRVLLKAIKDGHLRASRERARGWNVKQSDLQKWIESL